MVELMGRAVGLAELGVRRCRGLGVVGWRAAVVADGRMAWLGGCRVRVVVGWGLVVGMLLLLLLLLDVGEREGERRGRGRGCVGVGVGVSLGVEDVGVESVCCGRRWRERGRVVEVGGLGGQRCHGEIGPGAVGLVLVEMAVVVAVVVVVGVHLGGMSCGEGRVLPRS